MVEILLGGARAASIHPRLLHRDHSLHAPHLVEVEVTHVLRRLNFSGQLTDLRGLQALRDLKALGLRLHAHEPLLRRAWTLRSNLTAYDGVYVALAEALRAPLLTLDARLAGTRGHAATIELA